MIDWLLIIFIILLIANLIKDNNKVRPQKIKKYKNIKPINFNQLAPINMPVAQLPGVKDFDVIKDYIDNHKTLSTTIQHRTDAVMKIFINHGQLQIFVVSLINDDKPIYKVKNNTYNQLENYFYNHYSKLNCNINNQQLFAYPRLELVGTRLYYKTDVNTNYNLLTIAPNVEKIADNGILKTKIDNNNWTIQSYPQSMHQYIADFLAAKTNVLYIADATAVVDPSELPVAAIGPVHNCPSANGNVCHRPMA